MIANAMNGAIANAISWARAGVGNLKRLRRLFIGAPPLGCRVGCPHHGSQVMRGSGCTLMYVHPPWQRFTLSGYVTTLR